MFYTVITLFLTGKKCHYALKMLSQLEFSGISSKDLHRESRGRFQLQERLTLKHDEKFLEVISHRVSYGMFLISATALAVCATNAGSLGLPLFGTGAR